jgi:hypothetical protein
MKRFLLIISICQIGIVYSQIENGLVAHFPFNNDLTDVSVSGINVTNIGGVFGNDRNNTSNEAISLNGTSSYVSFNDNSIKQDLPISISVWVYVDAFDGTSSSPIFLSDSEYNNYWGYMLALTPTGKVYTQFGAGLGNAGPPNKRGFLTNNSISVGTWHHIVAIIKAADDMDIYVDCQKWIGTYSGTGSTTIAYSSTDSRIGSEAGNSVTTSGTYFDGSIDQLAIWERELISNEITFLCDTNNPLSISELSNNEKHLVEITDMMGRITTFKPNTPLILIYSDGSRQSTYTIEY